MSPTLLRLVTADLDAYEADRLSRADLQARYHFALQVWDELEMRRVEALAADLDSRSPGLPPVLDGLDTPSYPAAA
jgi:hypothetical protein